jgi:nitroreductase
MNNNEIYKIIIKRRSIRRYKQKPIILDILIKFLNAARLAPSAANLQPLEFCIVNDKDLCSKVFKAISWAGYIKPEWHPNENERPVAYIIILVNDSNNPWYLRDVSFAASNIVLCAEGQGIGSCVLCKINKEKIRKSLKIPKKIIIDSVIALGYKAEQPIVEDIVDSVEYYRDEKQVLHVPKRKIKDMIHINQY